MKKLLLILLLFFPFHGAWAKNLLYLSCTIKVITTFEIYPIVDLDQHSITNHHGAVVALANITDRSIEWTTSEGGQTHINSINRVNGQIRLYVVETDKEYYGKCEKTSGKKKF